MYDTGKIIPGLAVFVGLVTSPFWWNPLFGSGAAAPKLEKPALAKKCVEETSYMRSSHMQLLLQWRETTVRDGVRTYASADGPVKKSLTNTCLACHGKREVFCDRCHAYVDVKPFCWDCHLDAPDKEKV